MVTPTAADFARAREIVAAWDDHGMLSRLAEDIGRAIAEEWEALEVRALRAEAALEPFAEFIASVDDQVGDCLRYDDELLTGLTVAPFREAARVLREARP